MVTVDLLKNLKLMQKLTLWMLQVMVMEFHYMVKYVS